MGVHGSSVGKVLVHPLHQLGEAAESQSLCAERRDSTAGLHRHCCSCSSNVPPESSPRVGSWEPGSITDKRDPAPHAQALHCKGPPPTWTGKAEQSHPLTIIQDDQERGQQVTHALHVANLNVLPDVAVGESRRDDLGPECHHLPTPLPIICVPSQDAGDNHTCSFCYPCAENDLILVVPPRQGMHSTVLDQHPAMATGSIQGCAMATAGRISAGESKLGKHNTVGSWVKGQRLIEFVHLSFSSFSLHSSPWFSLHTLPASPSHSQCPRKHPALQGYLPFFGSKAKCVQRGLRSTAGTREGSFPSCPLVFQNVLC